MTTAWITVLALAVGTAVIKGTGPQLLARRELPGRARAVIAVLPAAVLAALVITDTFGTETRSLTLDPRAFGLAAAAIAIVLRLPMLAVIVVAACATALLRVIV